MPTTTGWVERRKEGEGERKEGEEQTEQDGGTETERGTRERRGGVLENHAA